MVHTYIPTSQFSFPFSHFVVLFFESVNFVTVFVIFIFNFLNFLIFFPFMKKKKESGQANLYSVEIDRIWVLEGGGTPIGNNCLLTAGSFVVDGHALISFLGCSVHVVE